MTISLVQKTATPQTMTGGSTWAAVGLPSAVTSGNLITCKVAVYAGGGAPVFSNNTDSLGDTMTVARQDSHGTDPITSAIIWGFAGSSSTLTHTPSSTSSAFYAKYILEEWSSTDGWPANPVDVVIGTSNTNTTPVTGTSAAKSGNGGVLLGLMSGDISTAAGIDPATSTSGSLTNAFIEQDWSSTINCSGDYLIIPAGNTSTENISWGTISTSAPWTGSLVFLKDNSTSGGGGFSTWFSQNSNWIA